MPNFHPIPENRSSHWRMVSSVIAEWFDSPVPSGFDLAELQRAESRLAQPLPIALREWYLLCGNMPRVWNVQDYLLSPSELFVKDDQLVFAQENQNVVRWSISVASLVFEDPVVNVSDVDDERLLHPCSATVSAFALQLLIMNAKFSRGTLFRANGPVVNSVITAIQAHLTRLPFPDLSWPQFPTQLYGNDRMIAELDGDTWLWVTARDSNAFDATLRILEGVGMVWEAVERPQ